MNYKIMLMDGQGKITHVEYIKAIHLSIDTENGVGIFRGGGGKVVATYPTIDCITVAEKVVLPNGLPVEAKSSSGKNEKGE